MWALANIWLNQFPAPPTNGSPISASCSPGASAITSLTRSLLGSGILGGTKELLGKSRLMGQPSQPATSETFLGNYRESKRGPINAPCERRKAMGGAPLCAGLRSARANLYSVLGSYSLQQPRGCTTALPFSIGSTPLLASRRTTGLPQRVGRLKYSQCSHLNGPRSGGAYLARPEPTLISSALPG